MSDHLSQSGVWRPRRFASPEDALFKPRSWLRTLLPWMRRLGFPEPDEHWERTMQVNWTGKVPFGTRFLCLYLGHDLRLEPRPRSAGYSGQLVCTRCEWDGPWQ